MCQPVGPTGPVFIPRIAATTAPDGATGWHKACPYIRGMPHPHHFLQNKSYNPIILRKKQAKTLLVGRGHKEGPFTAESYTRLCGDIFFSVHEDSGGVRLLCMHDNSPGSYQVPNPFTEQQHQCEKSARLALLEVPRPRIELGTKL